MASKVDMSLDEIIVKTKVNRRGRGGRGLNRGARGQSNRGQSRGASRGASTRPVAGRGRSSGRGGIQRGASRPARSNFRSQRGGSINGRWSHDMYYGGAASVVRTAPSGPTKLNISNLDYGVSDSDIKELFSEFGNMRAAAVHYDRSGRSLGTAHVMFDRRADALKAINQYNGVHLDGRPMNIAIDGEGAASATAVNGVGSFRLRGGPRNVKRLQAGPKPIGGGIRGRRGMPAGRGRGGLNRRGAANVRGGTNTNRGGANRRGTNRRGGAAIRRGGAAIRRGGRGGKQKVPTAAELDAELDSYRFQTSK